MAKLYTKKEVAQKLGIHRNTLFNWEKRNLVPGIKKVGNRNYYTDETLIGLSGN